MTAVMCVDVGVWLGGCAWGRVVEGGMAISACFIVR